MNKIIFLFFLLKNLFALETQSVNYKEENEISVITINHPKLLNSLNIQVLDELEKTLDNIDTSKIKAVIITGEGEKSFVANSEEAAIRFSKRQEDIFRKIESLSLPVIAAVNGIAIGGGLELSLSCDIRICSNNAIFGIKEDRQDFTISSQSIHRLSKIIGIGMAKQMAFTSKKIDAEKALEIGLVTGLYPQKELLNEAKKIALDISKNDQIWVKTFKQSINKRRFKKFNNYFNLRELMKDRHSSRNYQSRKVPENILRDIISDGVFAPSWENSQPWNIYVAYGEALEEVKKVWISKNNEKIKGYADMNPGHRTYFSKRGQKCMEDLMNSIGQFIHDPELEMFSGAQHVLFNAPAIVYLTLHKGYTNYSIYDVGSLGYGIMLSAKAHGVDSIPAYELIKYPDVLRSILDIPEEEDIIIGIALGYEDDNIMNKYRTSRLPFDEVCHFRNKAKS